VANPPFRGAPLFVVPTGQRGSVLYEGDVHLDAFVKCLGAALQAKIVKLCPMSSLQFSPSEHPF
jgi:hypothetical protein